MLQRIYGTAFPSKDLSRSISHARGGEERDHRSRGRSWSLYSIHRKGRRWAIFWHPHGSAMRRVITSGRMSI